MNANNITSTAIGSEGLMESDVKPEVTEEKRKQEESSYTPVYFTEEEARSLGAFEETAVTEEDVMAALSPDTDHHES